MISQAPQPSLIKKYGFLVFSVIAFGLYLHYRPTKIAEQSAERALPELGKLEPFTLTNQDDQTFGLADLDGKVWLVSFFFSSCEGPCPLINQKMIGLQKDLSDLDHFHLVSITVDPENDRPEVLREHSEKLGAHPGRWDFLTGEKTDIIDIARSIFKVPVGEDPVMHSTRLILVDQNSVIRGYFDSQEPDVREKIVAAVSKLTGQGQLGNKA